MLDRFAWLVEGLVVLPERMRANLEASHGLFFCQRVLLALVEAGLARDEAYRLVQEHALRAWDEGLDFRTLVEADERIAGRIDLAARLRPRRVHAPRRRRLRPAARPDRARRRSMSETLVHVASGKVRELFTIDDERLLLVASDRISTFDVVLPTEIPDKGRVLTGLSAFWFARTRDLVPEPPARAAAGRPLDGVPAARDAAARVRGARLPRRLGVEGLPARGSTSGHALPEGLRESDRLPEPIFTPSTKATSGPRREHRRRAGGSARRRGALRARSSEPRSRSTASRPSTQPPRGILIADTKFEFGLDADGQLVLADEAFTPDSSRFWPADEYEPGGAQPSFDKQFVRDYCESLGWDKTPPGPELPDEVVAGTRARYVEAFERLTGIAFDDYLADPAWC